MIHRCACRTAASLFLFSVAVLLVGCGYRAVPGSIRITAAASSVSVGQTLQLTAVDTNAARQVSTVTSTATWKSSTPSVASVSSSGLMTGVSRGSAILTATSANGDTGAIAMAVTSAGVTGLTVSPAGASLVVGSTKQYAAVATYSDSTTANVSASTAWSVAPASIATVSASGLVTAQAAGSFTVTATVSGQSATAAGTVGTISPVLSAISITPANASIASGNTQQFTATGTFSDLSTQDVSSSVSWTSSNPDRLRITSTGLATALSGANASVLVTATKGSVTASVAVTLTPGVVLTDLVVEPTSSSIPLGAAEKHTATAFYSDGTQKDVSELVAWSSADESLNYNARTGGAMAQAVHRKDDTSAIASIDSDGITTGTSPGTSSVTAEFGGLSQQSVVLVTPATATALAISAKNSQFPAGSIQQVTLTGTFSDGSTQDVTLSANWVSSNPAVASIDSAGVAHGLTPGAVVFQASFGGLTASTTGFAVLPTNLVSITIKTQYPAYSSGIAQQLQVIGTYSDGSTHDLTGLAKFSSSDPSVYVVDASGSAYGVAGGQAQITATVGNSSAVTSVLSTPNPFTSIAVFPVAYHAVLGSHMQFTALGLAPGGNFDVTTPALWTSSDPTVFTIDGKGWAKTGRLGTTTITATLQGNTAVSLPVTVTNATLENLFLITGRGNQAATTIAADTTEQFTAVGLFSDNTNQDLSLDAIWDTADHTIATVDADGTVRGIRAGQTMVTAKFWGSTASAMLTVTNATLVSTAISPAAPELPQGIHRQFSLIGTFSDGSTQDISADAIFQAPTPVIVTVVPQGLGIGLGVGLGQIAAQLGFFNASTAVNVTDATLSSLSMSPSVLTLRVGTSGIVTPTGTFSDGYVQDLTGTVFFQSGDVGTSDVLQNGLVTGNKVGTTTVTASLRGLTASSTLRVLSNTLTGIALSPGNASITPGSTQQLTAIGTYDDGSTGDVSDSVTWTSSVPTVLAVSASGLATAYPTATPVSVTVTALSNANMGGIRQSFTVLVSPAGSISTAPTLTSIVVGPAGMTLPAGLSTPLTATGVYSDGSTQDLTQSATWRSTQPATATVSPAGLVSGVSPGQSTISATLLSATGAVVHSFAQGAPVSGGTVVTVSNAVVRSVAISPGAVQFAAGVTQQFTATATLTDGITQDVTTAAHWTSSNPSAATIGSSTGLATGVAQGSVAFTATYGGVTAVSGQNTVGAATLVSVAVSPSGGSLTQGASEQLIVTGRYTDGSTRDLTQTATYSSSNPAAVSVSSTGLVTAPGFGTAQITITVGGKTFTTAPIVTTAATLTSLAITPSVLSVAAGLTRQLTATGTYSDGSTRDLTGTVTWSSAANGVATVNASGVVTGVGIGATTVQAMSGTVTASRAVNVTAAVLQGLTVTPTSARIAAGTTQQLTATGTYSDGTTRDLSGTVAWSTEQPGTATVSASGVVTGLVASQTVITAVQGSLSGSATIIVSSPALRSLAISPSGASFAVGVNQQYTLTGTFSDGSTQDLTGAATWSSNTPSIAAIGSSTGLATAIAAGSAQFTATYEGRSVTSAPSTVTPATLVSLTVNPSGASIAKGTTQQFTVTGTYSDGTTHDLTAQASYASSDATVVQVNATGLASGIGVGSAQLTISAGGQSVTTPAVTVTSATLQSIAITPANPPLAAGTAQQFSAAGTFSDGTTQDLTTQAVWTSSNPSVLTVSATGYASTSTPGQAQLTATVNGVSATTGSIQITPAIMTALTISPATAQVAKGTSQQFTATGTFSDGSTQIVTSQVTWTSSSSGVLGVSSTGLAIGQAQGVATLTAGLGTQTATSGAITITPATLVSLSFLPATPQVAAGTQEQLTVLGRYTDGTTQDLTSTATFSSSNGAEVSVSGNGILAGVAPGSSVVTIGAGGLTSTVTVTTTIAMLSSIAVTPNPPASVAIGANEQFTLTGTYSDGHTQNLSSFAAWTSDAAVLTINGTGLATGTGIGSGTVTATYGGLTAQSASFAVVLGTPSLTSIAVTPTSAQLPAGVTQQLTATGVYSDGSMQDLTHVAAWTSLQPGTASVGSSGLVTGVMPGQATIAAQVNGAGNSATIVVTAAVLRSLAISPSGATFAAGSNQQFNLTGTYSDGTIQTLTTQASWASSNASVAVVNAATGLAAGIGQGTVQFTATYAGQTIASSTNTVSPATLVSLAVSPSSGSFAKGTSDQFTVTGTYSDGSTRDLTSSSTYTSSNPSIISMSAGGLATGAGTGTASVTITAGGQSFTTQPITVSPATLVSVAITPNTPSFANGTSQQFIAAGIFTDGSSQDLTNQVVWTSTDAAVVIVNNNGLATATGLGSAQISASFNGTRGTTGLVTVTPAIFASLMLTPSSASIAKGTTQQFTATATFTDGSTQNVSAQATWTTSDGTVAGVNASGLATGNAAGSAQIAATYGTQVTSTSSFAVTPATLVSIAFAPANPTVAAGTTAQVTVTGTYSDGSTQDLTSSATFSTSNAAVTTVSGTGLIAGVAPGSATVTVTAGGQAGSVPVIVSNAVLASIAIAPNPPSALPKGTTEQFTAIGTYTDGSHQDLSTTATWSSSAPAVASISGSGLATGVSLGPVTLTATYWGQTASTPALQVTQPVLKTLTVTPATKSLPVGQQQQYTAVGTYSDATTQDLTTQVTWASSDGVIASISTGGQVTALVPGGVSIAAFMGTTTGSASLTVVMAASPATLTFIAITPASASIVAGGTVQYTATGSYSDGSSQSVTSSVTWSSSNAAAAISSSGLATGVSAGATTITASTSGVTSNSASLTITSTPVTLSSLVITPSPATVGKSATVQFIAWGMYSDGTTQDVSSSVTWSSTNHSIATIDASGLATGIAAGNTQIGASFSGYAANSTLTVSPATLTSLAVTPQTASVANGTKQQYAAVGTFSDGSTQDLSTSVNWTSSNTTLATIDANGLASTLATGSDRITAGSGGATSNQATLTISAASVTSIQVTPSTINLPAGSSQQLVATATFTDGSSQDVTTSATYTTSNSSVATVNAGGVLRAIGPGTATVTVTLQGVMSTTNVTVSNAVLSSIAVTPANPSVPVGLSQQLAATGIYTDGSTQDLSGVAAWTSSDSTNVAVSSTGNATGAKEGAANVIATYSGVSGADTVTVTAATVTSIAVSPTPVTLAAGATQQFAATATMSDGSQQNVMASAHWSVSDPSKASISNTAGSQGLFSATAAGNTNAVATVGTVSGSAAVTVTAATLSSIAINPQAFNSLPAGTTLQLSVTGTYSDSSSSDVTRQVTWTTGSASTAYVDTNALLHAVATGVVAVDAHLQGMSGTAVVSVSNATLVSIAVTPAASTLPLGTAQQLTATGTYSDGSTTNLTSQVQWSSSATGVASISSGGLITAVGTGSSSITATKNGVSGLGTATVTSATLQSLSITSAQSSFALGQSLQLKAVGTYSDGTTKDLTTAVAWTSTAPTVGLVSSTGVATGKLAGSFGAKATLNGVTATESLTVTSATLVSIAVTPGGQVLLNLLGQNLQFTATGTFSDGSTQNLAGSVHWAMTGIVVGTISQSGLFSPTGLGIGTVTATSGSITGSTGVTVVSVLGH